MLPFVSRQRLLSFAPLAAFVVGVHCVAPDAGESPGSSRAALVRDPRIHPASAGSVVEVASWVQVTPATSPPSRHGHAMAYDTARQRVVLFGGETIPHGVLLGDTWEWDGTTWAERTAASGDPPPRIGHALAYDVARARTVLFGAATADTWEWDGTAWQARTPATSPPVLSYFPMAYDVARARTILYGGEESTGHASATTWEWDGSTWSETLFTPGANIGGAMAYDPGLGEVVLIGDGASSSQGPAPLLQGMWDWDGTEWESLGTSNELSAPVWMVYDAAVDRLIGAQSSLGTSPDHTFTLEGSAWQEAVEPATLPRGGVAVYDEARGNVVLFVADQTWLLTLTPTQVGTTCASDGDCGSGYCVDQVCCATACDGQCEACDVASHEGVCTAVTGAPVGARAACAGSGVCGGECDGKTLTACAYPPPQTPCAAAACTAGVATGASSCDGAGACVAGATTSCGAYACGVTSCNTRCATGTDCAAGDACFAGGVCGPPLDLGTACASDGDCGSGHCVDQVCCDTACGGQCEACNVQAHAGQCTVVTGAPPAGRAACAGSGVCAGQCDGVQGDSCTFPSSSVACRAAACAAGTATPAASCDGAGGCPSPAATSCGPFACGATACDTQCTSDSECAPDLHCAIDGGSSACVSTLSGPDGGAPDAGPDGASDAAVDAATGDDADAPEAGAPDGGSADASAPDARAPEDAGAPTDGASDAPEPPSDASDAAVADGGLGGVTSANGDPGCGCRTTGAPVRAPSGWGLFLASAVVVFLRRNRRSIVPRTSSSSRSSSSTRA